MISRKCDEAGRQLERLWSSGTLTGLSDAQLLSRYVEARGRDAIGEAAFRELVERHAAMVLGVCRQILRRRHDVDDAFQATFLVLVRKADSIHVGHSIGPWLSSVAYRTAHRARTDAARHRSTDVTTLEEVARPSPDDGFHFDVRPLLHEELNRLPDKFRDPIVLCHLEGKSHEEAARLLRWPVGTVSSRLSRGRQILRSRLERRGVMAPAAIIGANWMAGTPASVAAPLLESTVNAAIGFAASPTVSAVVLSLTQGVLRMMWLRRLRTISLAVFLFGSVSGFAVWAHWPSTPSKSDSSVRDAGPASRPAQPPPGSQATSDDIQVADHPQVNCTDSSTGDLPAYCPISMATNAFSRMIDHFRHSE